VARRSYDQFCSLARTLDVVGERWTLLVVRELMLGPRRFSDFLPALPGVGRNLLSARLRHLEEQGLVARRTLPPPAGVQVYELTQDGRDLGPALAELSRWGVEHLEVPPPGAVFRPAWGMFPLSYMANTEAAAGLREDYEFRVGEETFTIQVRDGVVEPRTGPSDDPDLVVTMSPETLRELFEGKLAAMDGLGQGRITIEGPPEVLGHALAILAGTPVG
jgi:DNA-binding HxlR family transcriptional regulator